MNKQVTVLSLKDEIIKSYGHVYFEWSKQLDVELEVAHAILIGCNCQVWRATLFEFDYFRSFPAINTSTFFWNQD